MRRAVLLLTGAYLAGLLILAVLVFRATPGPRSQEILGVGIGSYEADAGIAFLSGRRLHCVPLAGDGIYAMACTVEIGGKPLEIRARRNAPSDPNQLGGVCAAFYDGKVWPCEIGSRHVQVPWFAYLSEPLGLSAAQLAGLRRTYLFENLPEPPLVQGMFAVPILTMSVVMLASGAWLWPMRSRKQEVVWASMMLGAFALVMSFVVAVFVTAGLWD